MKLKMLLLSTLIYGLGSSGLVYARHHHHHHYHRYQPHYFSQGRIPRFAPDFPRPRAYVYRNYPTNPYPNVHCHDGIC